MDARADRHLALDPAGKAADFEDKVCKYLDELRESGVTNMFGAAPYIAEEFGVDREEAKRLLVVWMKGFGKR